MFFHAVIDCCLLSLGCCGQNHTKVELVINLKNECMRRGQLCMTHLRMKDNTPTAIWFLFSMKCAVLLSIYFMAGTFNGAIKMQTFNSSCQTLSGNKSYHTWSKTRQAICYVVSNIQNCVIIYSLFSWFLSPLSAYTTFVLMMKI